MPLEWNSGSNGYIYFVCNYLGGPLVQLPHVTPAQVCPMNTLPHACPWQRRRLLLLNRPSLHQADMICSTSRFPPSLQDVFFHTAKNGVHCMLPTLDMHTVAFLHL